jgi:periplasmic protein CpxP/Spy
MKLSLAIALSLAAACSAGLAAGAQGPGEGMGPGRGGRGMGGPGFGMHRPPMEAILGPHGAEGRWWNNPAVIDRLKLTDDQRKTMDQTLLDHRKDLIDKRGAVEKAELDLEPLVAADQPNESQILGQIDKVAQARAELEKANARFLLAIRAKLSPEQWKELKAWRTERTGERRGWRDRPERGKPNEPPPAGGPGPQGVTNEIPAPDVPDVAFDRGSH